MPLSRLRSRPQTGKPIGTTPLFPFLKDRRTIMPETPYRHLRVHNTAGATVIAFVDRELDHVAATAAGEELFNLLAAQPSPQLRLDLGDVECLTSTALDQLVGLNKRVRAAGGEMTLENLQPFVYELLEVTRLTTLFRIRDKEDNGARAQTTA
jgi:anti-anti-sigma factor